MFDDLDSNRVKEKRNIWLHTQKHGKASFMLRTTALVTCVLSLIIYPIFRCLPQRQNRSLLIVASYISCLVIGYLVSELAWRRGLRLANKAP